MSVSAKSTVIGQDAIIEKGWLKTHQWLLLRRVSQLSILGLFLLGPLASIWWIKGNLSASLLFGTIPMADPFLLLQTFFSGHQPDLTAILGALIIFTFYFLVGGRVFCSWVCPVNIVTDSAGWLRRRLGLRKSTQLARSLRYWILAMCFITPLFTGYVVWELINPVSMLHRGLIFGMGMGWSLIIAIFLFDLFISRRGWCGHVCPMGAFYSLVGKYSPLKVSASDRSKCNDCMDCYAVCPEPQVIRPALKGEASGVGPVIIASDCTNCGRCIDICAKDVFHYSSRFANKAEK